MNEKDFGCIKFKLGNLIVEKGISKSKLAHRAEMQRTQLNNYCNGKVTRIDTVVLSRLCTVLECNVEDIIEFVPAVHTESAQAHPDPQIQTDNAAQTCIEQQQ